MGELEAGRTLIAAEGKSRGGASQRPHTFASVAGGSLQYRVGLKRECSAPQRGLRVKAFGRVKLAMPVFGISLPRHFIIQFDDGNYSTYIDPYNGGRTITVQECFALAGAKVADPILLRRASKKEIAMRMLQNLRGVYLRRRDWARAVDTLDLLLLGAPELSGLLKQRGLLHMELKHFQAARGDLERYLAIEPEAADREEIRKQIRAIHTWLAKVN